MFQVQSESRIEQPGESDALAFYPLRRCEMSMRFWVPKRWIECSVNGKMEARKLLIRGWLFLHHHHTIDDKGASGICVDIVYILHPVGSFVFVPHGKSLVFAGFFVQA